jgi:hypothetical protein
MLDGIWSLDESREAPSSDAVRGVAHRRPALPGTASVRTRRGFSARAVRPDRPPLSAVQVDLIEDVIDSARRGSVLKRSGHAGAAIHPARLAGRYPAGGIYQRQRSKLQGSRRFANRSPGSGSFGARSCRRPEPGAKRVMRVPRLQPAVFIGG